MLIQKLHELFLKSAGICTDTRKIEKNQLFFALKGDNFNGNLYASKALEAGACFAIIDEVAYKNEQTILVNDVLQTLQELAAYHRQYLNIPIIAITGSNGKTTTKELLQAVLSTTYKTYATFANLNNHIGVPLSLLAVNKTHELAVIEMGANHQKEIEAYCKWAQPNYGLITNIGKAHLEGFGGIEGVIKGKTELFTAVEQNQGTIFFNADDSILCKQITKVSKQLSYGTTPGCNFQYNIGASNTFIEIEFDGLLVKSHLIGIYNGVNMGAVIAIAKHFNVLPHNIKFALENYIPENNRSQILRKNEMEIILDAYNANPTSMQAALESFEQIKASKKAVFLGDMFEVGADSFMEHQKIVESLANANYANIVFVGNDFYANKNNKHTFFKTTNEAVAWFKNQNFKDYTILIKGSRGMKMESIIA